ncbi:hypothetical protein FEM48_Zijuj03G0093200 [Ziziphus jujuba var. spinosa]|uniref:RING-type domain-containing protein n=1 Tax=Ziziphus jujuba var. spinosa TaxID=714518 RepID=A0A978VPG7_ZIZJJ|nr:hypothetical protein FEM48_Zijuj03G0093200 [Ziziphus jujuba var. spinosa]
MQIDTQIRGIEDLTVGILVMVGVINLGTGSHRLVMEGEGEGEVLQGLRLRDREFASIMRVVIARRVLLVIICTLESNIPHGDDHQNFHFIDDQMIIDRTTRILPSSPRSTGSKARTRAVDRLRRTTHERVVAENEKLGGCSICLEEFSARTELLRFGCKHLYHQNCIAKWLENQNSCPLCRRPL